MVTGGSGNIGIEFCNELAKLDFNLILISKTKENLKKASDQLKKVNSKIDVITI